jgi:1-acyl-sn-glycerol-3-phosphate acyltransferase
MYQSYFLVRLMPIWKITIEGREKCSASPTWIVISNHQSIIDILLINSLRIRYKWVSKIENLKLPVLGWYLRMADYITVNRGNEDSKVEMLDKSYRFLKNGTSVALFPEGTRSLNGEIGFYKRGAFQLALLAGIPILPVLIDGTGDILPKHGILPGTGYDLHVRVLDPVFVKDFGTDLPDELALRISEMMKNELKKLRSGK